MFPIFKITSLHIPDGFLSLPVSITFWVITVLLVTAAVRRTRGELAERQVPLMGVMAAFIFAAQMINFPVAGGTSGHFLGGALAAITLGPWAGMLIMTAVIAVQALVFQDGGLVVMGANIFNMGLITAAVGSGLFRLGQRRSRVFKLGVAAVAAWLSLLAAALATTLQLWLSGTSSLAIVFTAMMSIHFLIGIGEGIITAAALSFIWRIRPDLVGKPSNESTGRGWMVVGLVISVLVVLITPFASVNPDGLERVAEDLGFLDKGLATGYTLFPDYSLPFMKSDFSTITAGLIGFVVVGIIVFWVGRRLRRRRE